MQVVEVEDQTDVLVVEDLVVAVLGDQMEVKVEWHL
jgi:hypothetical protein